MSDGDTEPPILRPAVSLRHYDYRSHPVFPPFVDTVATFWTVSWDLAHPYTAQVLPWPSVNLTVTDTEAAVTGLVRRRYERHLRGRGFAVGARFRPGGFRPYFGRGVAELTNQHRPISEVLGRDTSELRLLVESEPDPAVRVRLLSTFLATIQPERDATAGAVADLVDEISRRRDLTQVGQVADLAGLSVRGLQRLFADYVGAGPKWVIQRFRLQEAAARAAGPGPVNWSALALELGFADQAHLTRVFTATIGTSPAAFAAEAHG